MKQKVTKKTMEKARALIGAGLTQKETQKFLKLSSATIHYMVKARFDHSTYRELVREAAAKTRDYVKKVKATKDYRVKSTKALVWNDVLNAAQNGAIKTGTTTVVPTETLHKVREASKQLFDLLTEVLRTTKT